LQIVSAGALKVKSKQYAQAHWILNQFVHQEFAQ